MTATSERPGLSLASRVAVVSAVLVALPAVAAVLAVLLVGGRIADGAVAASLSRSGVVQEHFQRMRAEQLALISRVISTDPAFAGYVAEAAGAGLGSPAGVDSLSIVDLLAERRAELGYDFALVLDPRGRVLARTDRPGEVGQDLSGDPLVARALEQLTPATGLWTSGGALYQAAIVPLAVRLDLVGFLVTTLGIDDRLAAEMARIGGTDVVFVAKRDPGPAILASSLDLARSSALGRDLEARPDRLRPVLEEGHELPRLDLVVEEETLVGRADALTDAAGRPVGALLALGSPDRQQLAFRGIRNVVLLAGVLSTALAVGLSFVFVRRALDPLRRLADAAETAASGDYDRGVAPATPDEVGRVGRALNSLLGELRERLAMAAYVAEIARHLPETAPLPAAPTASGADARAQLPTEDNPVSDRGDAVAGTLRPGSVVAGRYEILATLGSGGMGRVFKARDAKLGELVALKVLHPSTMGVPDLERVKNEIRLARRITHPNVLRTFDYGEDATLPYISMEYVRGLTLDYLLRQTRGIPRAAGLFLGRHVCAGLAAAHAVGVLHRDIKPANLIVEPGGNVKLMDFGVALLIRVAGVASGSEVKIAGTPYYLAPEVLGGDEPGVAADLYSVGLVLYEVFSGSPPFPPTARLEELVELKRRPLEAPSSRGTAVPQDLERIVLGCVDPDPARRPTSADSLRGQLETVRC